MNERQFFIQLTIVTFSTSILIWLFSFIPLFHDYQPLSIISILLFVSISIIMYYTGRWGVQHNNKNTFITLMYAYMGGKMILSIFVIMLYYLYVEPSTNLFILPFFLVYFIYTIFESYFLMKVNELG